MKRLITGLSVFILSQVSAWSEYRVVGYFPEYRVSALTSIDWTPLTHVNVSFVNPDDAGDFNVNSDIQSIVDAAKNAGKKVNIALGGAGVNETPWTTAMEPANQEVTAQKILAMVQKVGADGVDVDLESGLMANANYNSFVQTLGKKIKGSGLLYTAALAEWEGSWITDATLKVFDFVNIMAYDETGSWSGTKLGQHSTMSGAQAELTYWTSRGLTKDKAVLGVPFYGYDFYGFTGKNYNVVSEFSWSDIVLNHPEAIDLDSVFSGNEKKYYNGRVTIRKKCALALNYGGVMIWELGQDDYSDKNTSLLNVIQLAKDSLTKTNPIIQSKGISNTRIKISAQNFEYSEKQQGEWFLFNSAGEMMQKGEISDRITHWKKSLNQGQYILKFKDETGAVDLHSFIIQQ